MATEWPPAPPESYRLHDPELVRPWYVATGLLVWIVAAFVGVLAVVLWLHGFETAVTVAREVFLVSQMESAREVGVFIVWLGATIVVSYGAHEALHALAAHWFGFRTEFHLDYRFPVSVTPMIVPYGDFQSRSEEIAISLTPLVVMTPVSIIVLVVAHQPWLIGSAAISLLANSAGAVHDLGGAWDAWNLPVGELMYNNSDGRRQYYTLKSGRSRGLMSIRT